MFGVDTKKIMLQTIAKMAKQKVESNKGEDVVFNLKEVREYIEKELPEFSISIREQNSTKELFDVSIKLGLKKWLILSKKRKNFYME